MDPLTTYPTIERSASEPRGDGAAASIGAARGQGWDRITSLETEPTSRWYSNSRTFAEPMHEATQMAWGPKPTFRPTYQDLKRNSSMVEIT